MRLSYNGYELQTECRQKEDKRYFVCVLIEKEIHGEKKYGKYFDTSNTYVLEIEAEKEAINFGKNLIKLGIVNF